jgi:hypothetical protein
MKGRILILILNTSILTHFSGGLLIKRPLGYLPRAFNLPGLLIVISSILIMLLPLLLWPKLAQAANVFVTINSPATETNLSSAKFAVSISYNADFDKGYSTHPTDEYHWKVSLSCYGPPSGNATTSVLSFQQEVTTISGGASFSVNLPVQGRWQLVASIDQPTVPYGRGWTPIETDTIYINYGSSSSSSVDTGPQPGSSSDSGDFNPVPLVVGGGAVLAAGLVIRSVVKKSKAKAVKPQSKPAPGNAKSDLYQEWWNKASPQERQNWDSFEKFLSSRLGPAKLNGFIDQYGRPSWASAYTSWQKELQNGQTSASFEDWAGVQGANEQQTREMMDRGQKMNRGRSKDIVEASEKYSESLRNKERFEKLQQISKAVSGDSNLSNFVGDARKSIVNDKGEVDSAKLARLEGTLKNWINRDKMGPETSDYTSSDAYYDTVKQASGNILIRGGMAYLTGGYSEIAMNPISAVSTMRQSINEGKSTLRAVADGYVNSSFELAIGESGRLVKYASPYLQGIKESYNLSKLSGMNSELASEVSTINQLAKQSEIGKYSRNAYMKGSEVVKLGQTSAAGLDSTEKMALNLSNNPEFKELLANNPGLVPDNVKEVMGAAKQKVYEQARNSAIGDVMNQMGKECLTPQKNPFFIQQTGTHARPGNPGWNPVKSDFDHTVDFGSSQYNQLYEQKFDAHLASQGTSASAIDANVYGAGTSSKGAYEGGALKFVQNYNQTNGSDIMIRTNSAGQTIVSREEPQMIDSLLGKMKSEDVASAKSNYQNFFQKSVEKGGSLDNVLTNSSKEVSRTAGQYSVNYVDNFQKTGGVNYQVPDAAKVADLVKKQGFTVDNAMQKVGYGGNKNDLLSDFKKIMGR